jgi:hypothetical protein
MGLSYTTIFYLTECFPLKATILVLFTDIVKLQYLASVLI